MLAAGAEVRETAPAQSQVQDRPGRRPDRHQRRRRRPRHDRRRLARPARRATPRASSSTRSPSTRSASITNKANTLCNLTHGAADQRSSPARRARGAACPEPSASGTIDLISRTSVAGVLTNFQTLLLEGKKVASVAAEEPSEGLLRQQVENDPNAIGFVSNYQSDKGGVNVVGVNGVGVQQIDGRLRPVRRAWRVLRGDEGQGRRAPPSAFIGWIEQLGRRAQDHLDAVDPDHARAGRARRACAVHGPTTAPSARSARCRCLVARARRGDGRVRRRPRLADVPAQRPQLARARREQLEIADRARCSRRARTRRRRPITCAPGRSSTARC